MIIWVMKIFFIQFFCIFLAPLLNIFCFCSVQFIHSVLSDSLQPRESQHARPYCPSPTRGVHSDSHPSSQLCHPAISSSVVPFSSRPQSLPPSVFSSESTLRMRWPKYWSFSFSIIPSKEIPGLISFRMDWLDHLAVPRDSQESSSTPQFKSIYIRGEGNGNPLQYSRLENPMDGGAWWAAVHGVAKNRTRLSDFTFSHWRRKWQPTPVFLPGESQGRGSLVGCRLWGCTESDTTEAT